MRIDPRLIIEFSAVAEEGSFTRAAQRLRMAQPWLSARIRRLEELLGFDLFTRNTRRITLSERGAAFFAAARTVASAVENAGALAVQLKRPDHQKLRIGVAPYTKNIRERRKLIESFTESYHGFSLELDAGWSLSLIDWLKQGRIDLTFMMGEFDTTALEGLLLRHFGLALTMSPDNPLAAHPTISTADLHDQKIYVFTRSLNPALWDLLHQPLISEQLSLIEAPEIAEGAPDLMDDHQSVVAFFDFNTEVSPLPAVVQKTVASPKNVPFWLLRRRGDLLPASQIFWNEARSISEGYKNARDGVPTQLPLTQLDR